MSNEVIWTWILLGCELVGVVGMLLIGARRASGWGWLLVVAHSIPWLVYSIAFNKPGFIAMSAMWIIVHTRNMHLWHRHTKLSTSNSSVLCEACSTELV
jgi:hypothetical protein